MEEEDEGQRVKVLRFYHPAGAIAYRLPAEYEVHKDTLFASSLAQRMPTHCY